MKILQKNFVRFIDTDKLSHAYLFFGQSSNDEIFSFAQSLANYLENKKFEAPKKILEEALIIEPEPLKKNISIGAIRDLSKFLYQQPVFSKKRVAIIKDSGKMSAEAQNAALKITEEAPESALIIFIAKNEDSLLPALTSRLQKIYFAERQNDNLISRVIPAKAGIQRPSFLDPRLRGDDKKSGDDKIENDQIDEFFEQLIAYYQKNPIKNQKELREIFKRLVAIKQFNTNKKLQIRTIV